MIKGLLWGTMGPFLLAAAMVMVVGCWWLLGISCSVLASAQTYSGKSTDLPTYCSSFGLNYLDWSKFYSACQDRLAKLYTILYLDQI
jgi:hypothetical protein